MPMESGAPNRAGERDGALHGGLQWGHPVPSWGWWLLLLLGHEPWRGGCVYHCCGINNAAEMLIIRELFNLAGTSRAGSSSWKLKLA